MHSTVDQALQAPSQAQPSLKGSLLSIYWRTGTEDWGRQTGMLSIRGLRRVNCVGEQASSLIIYMYCIY